LRQTEPSRVFDSLSAFGLNFVFVLPLVNNGPHEITTGSILQLIKLIFSVLMEFVWGFIFDLVVRFVPFRKLGFRLDQCDGREQFSVTAFHIEFIKEICSLLLVLIRVDRQTF
jgi:hypothetical protein